jgi:hypothetical protein
MQLKRIENESYSNDNILKQSDIDDENIVGQVTASWEVRSALMRYRSDFPNLDDDKWKVNIYHTW